MGYHDDVTKGLPAGDPRVDELLRLCTDLPPAWATVLHLFHAHPTTLMTVEDIADRLDLSLEEAGTILETMSEKGLLRRTAVANVTFYGLTDDKGTLGMITTFEAWCETQRRRWRPYQGVFHGE
jgi:hypothetical protein